MARGDGAQGLRHGEVERGGERVGEGKVGEGCVNINHIYGKGGHQLTVKDRSTAASSCAERKDVQTANAEERSTASGKRVSNDVHRGSES